MQILQAYLKMIIILAHKEQPFQTLQQHDVSWEKSVQFYDALTRFIINDFETNRNENTMTKQSTKAKYFGKTEPVSVKFLFRTPCSSAAKCSNPDHPELAPHCAN